MVPAGMARFAPVGSDQQKLLRERNADDGHSSLFAAAGAGGSEHHDRHADEEGGEGVTAVVPSQPDRIQPVHHRAEKSRAAGRGGNLLQQPLPAVLFELKLRQDDLTSCRWVLNRDFVRTLLNLNQNPPIYSSYCNASYRF